MVGILWSLISEEDPNNLLDKNCCTERADQSTQRIYKQHTNFLYSETRNGGKFIKFKDRVCSDVNLIKNSEFSENIKFLWNQYA